MILLGCLLNFFKGEIILALELESTKNIATDAQNYGMPTINQLFNSQLAQALARTEKKTDHLIDDNALTRVTNRNEFVARFIIIFKTQIIFKYSTFTLIN